MLRHIGKLQQRLAFVRIFCAGLVKIVKPLFGSWLCIIGLVQRNSFKQIFGFYWWSKSHRYFLTERLKNVDRLRDQRFSFLKFPTQIGDRANIADLEMRLILNRNPVATPFEPLPRPDFTDLFVEW
jgi:hypothetical protein